MTKGDIVMVIEGNSVFKAVNRLVNGVVEVLEVQGSIFLGRSFNESGTYNYIEGKVEDFHKVV